MDTPALSDSKLQRLRETAERLGATKPPGIIPDRITLIFDCFADLGTLKGFGQTQVAREMGIAPQIIRRRATDARQHRHVRGMPIDQVKQLSQIAVREIPPLKGLSWERVTAWLVGLDTVTSFEQKVRPALVKWHEQQSQVK